MKDTNTLREEFVKDFQRKYEIHPVELGLIADYWLNKFNQKLEEIEKTLENHAKQNTYEDEEALVYKTTMNEVLQIIKNKKN